MGYPINRCNVYVFSMGKPINKCNVYPFVDAGKGYLGRTQSVEWQFSCTQPSSVYFLLLCSLCPPQTSAQ